ncbi:MOSC domain-containing protein, partial [Alicyclobacillus sp.]|uniref:MOSC domain-containing protein n=1 Tax=Alicyclobacillus sp. TaxID=61169 RepID=UPI0025C0F8C6
MTILSVQVGLPRDVRTEAADGRPATWRSAIWKTPVQGPVWLGEENLAGDGQADRKNHGGPHRAMLWYAAAHYPHWRAELGLETLLFGWFGENLTVEGLDEASVCIGDVYRIGGPDGPVVQVSQPRKPCWKLARRVGVPDLVSRVESTGRSGWYTRVLKTGWVAPGD